jgi:hypothetical protein
VLVADFSPQSLNQTAISKGAKIKIRKDDMKELSSELADL